MQKILHLSPEVISKIAAGEVIERPVFAVKELIENAIDAKATIIEVSIEEAGLKRIKVIDNGEGMSREDLTICFLPHTTSKLTGDEIIEINTLGFRGEALSAIAAVSDLSIHSRTEDSEAGWSITLRKGSEAEVVPIGIPKGTIVEINNLFQSVPARRKFLKSTSTEFRYITELVTKFALSYPSIHFILSNNGKTVLDVPRRDSPVDRLKTLLGVSMVDQLIPLSFQESYVGIEGFIGAPQIALKNNLRQYLFVNNRLVSDKMISLAVKEAYGTLLPASNTPVFLLYLTLPAELLDVNIHPRKEQLAFENGRMVFDSVKLAVTETLQENNISFSLQKFRNNSLRKGETTSYAATLLKQQKRIDLSDLQAHNSVFQIADTYIVTSNEDSVILLDQHAAHERILFEDYSALFKADRKKHERVSLPKPLVLTVSSFEKQLFDEYADEIRLVGFELGGSESNSISIHAIPAIFQGRHIEKIIRDMLSDLENEQEVADIDLRSHRMLAFLACRGAVMAGQKLSVSEMKKIIRDLGKTANRETCPHGRPTCVTISSVELAGAFKR